MIGCEVETPDHIRHGMDLYELQPALYAVFRTIGPITESVQKTWDYIYAIWLNESGYSHAGTHDIKHYFCIEDELVADLYVPVIRKDY